MGISPAMGLAMVLFTTFLWGSWSQFVKKLGDFPIPAFILWLYFSGFVIISFSMIFLKGTFFPEGAVAMIRKLPAKCLLVFVCGATYSIGTQLSMSVVKKAGIIFQTSINAMLTIPIGCTVSSILGGIPENVSVFQLVLGVMLLIIATVLGQKSTRMRDADNGIPINEGSADRRKYIIILICCAVFFAPTYTIALSIGTRPENGIRLPSPLLVWILSAGSLIGTAIFSSVRLSKMNGWRYVFGFKQYRSQIAYSCLAGLFHYGGNLIHTIASPIVSVAIAWPLGYLSTIWQYFWGLVRGEYKGAHRKTMLTLFAGIFFFICALITLASALYWR